MTTHATTRGMGWWSCLLLLAAVILWTLNNSRRLRVAIFLLNGVFTVQLLVATVLAALHSPPCHSA